MFYNSPIIAELDGYKYIAYLKNDGKVCVAKLNCELEAIEQYIAHDYGNIVQNRRTWVAVDKTSDDHAAPAIIYDNRINTILLATSYHGSDANIYKFDKEANRFTYVTTIKGYYTYPRFITYKNNTLLFLREQVGNNRRTGNIVMFNNADGFSKKELIKESIKDMVIYASRPFLGNNNIYFSYGYHNYQKKYIEGWYILIYNLEKKESKVLNISSYTKDFIENRPTGIAVKDKTIRVATSYLENSTKEDYIKRHPSFELYNTVKILDLKYDNNLIMRVDEVLEKRVKLPYYGTSVYIDENLNYVFFDEDKIVSNLNFNYIDFDRKMYPYLYQNYLIYVVPKSEHSIYQIRNFHTDIRALKTNFN